MLYSILFILLASLLMYSHHILLSSSPDAILLLILPPPSFKLLLLIYLFFYYNSLSSYLLIHHSHRTNLENKPRKKAKSLTVKSENGNGKESTSTNKNAKVGVYQMKAKKYCLSPPARVAPPREPVVQWSYLWALLEESGWRKILIGDVTDPVYVAMKYYAEIYVNVTAKDIWKLEAFFHGEIRCGEHYFQRYVCTVVLL